MTDPHLNDWTKTEPKTDKLWWYMVAAWVVTMIIGGVIIYLWQE